MKLKLLPTVCGHFTVTLLALELFPGFPENLSGLGFVLFQCLVGLRRKGLCAGQLGPSTPTGTCVCCCDGTGLGFLFTVKAYCKSSECKDILHSCVILIYESLIKLLLWYSLFFQHTSTIILIILMCIYWLIANQSLNHTPKSILVIILNFVSAEILCIYQTKLQKHLLPDKNININIATATALY